MEIKILTINTAEDSFETVFAEYKQDFLRILSKAYETYYGDDYQLKRLIEDKSVLYLALVNNILVGVSYIKKNHRRGGTAVFPEQYRQMGIAGKLVKESFVLFPKQYTILRVDNHIMLSLMHKLGFKKATSPEEIESIVQDECSQLSDFEWSGDYLIFKRRSIKRETERESLTLLHTY